MTHVSEAIHCLSFFVWLTSPRTIPSRSIRVDSDARFLLFLRPSHPGLWVGLQPHPLICRSTLRWVPQFGHLRTAVMVIDLFELAFLFDSDKHTQTCNGWVTCQFYFSLFGEPPCCFPGQLHGLPSPPTVREGPPSCTLLPVLVIYCPLDHSRSDRCEVIAHCGFDFHLPDAQRCRASFHALASRLHVLFGKMSIQILCLLLIVFF